MMKVNIQIGLAYSLLMLMVACDSASNKGEERVVLFDGEDLSAWRSVGSDTFPESGWKVEDSLLFSVPGYIGGDIITREEFADFELELEYKLTDSANTGIKYLVAAYPDSTGKPVYIGPEFQLIDDFKHEAVVDDKNPAMSTGALYLLYAPQDKQLNPAGQWNAVRIRVLGPHVEHWLNGKKIVEYERGTKAFRDAAKVTKFHSYDGYGENTSGHILLQDHGDQAFFRNISLKKLTKN